MNNREKIKKSKYNSQKSNKCERMFYYQFVMTRYTWIERNRRRDTEGKTKYT